MKYILMNFVSVCSVFCALYALINGLDGWGWFLVVSVLFGHNFEKPNE